MGDIGASQQTQSLVSMFDELLIQQEEARTEVHHTGPEYFLKVLEVSALTQARDSDQRREAADQILCLEREVERLQSQVSPAWLVCYTECGEKLFLLSLCSPTRKQETRFSA